MNRLFYDILSDNIVILKPLYERADLEKLPTMVRGFHLIFSEEAPSAYMCYVTERESLLVRASLVDYAIEHSHLVELEYD